jgi:hypothetical protein
MVTIFIRTYKRDVAWLDYCLQSIQKNLKGWDEIVVCIPEGQEHHLRFAKDVRIVTSPVFPNDYVGQQVSKLLCHHYIKGDMVLIVDSDLIFLPGASVQDYLENGKPRILTCKWSVPPDKIAIKWRPIIGKLLGKEPPCSFMKGHGARLFLKSTLQSFSAHFPNIEAYARKQPRKEFSEFQFLGFFLYLNEPQNYHLLELTESPMPQYHTRQFWNVDGITKLTVDELAQYNLNPQWPNTLSPWDQFRRQLRQITRQTKQWFHSLKQKYT